VCIGLEIYFLLVLEFGHDSFYVLSCTILVWFDPVFRWWVGRCSGSSVGLVYIEVTCIFSHFSFWCMRVYVHDFLFFGVRLGLCVGSALWLCFQSAVAVSGVLLCVLGLFPVAEVDVDLYTDSLLTNFKAH